MYVKVGMSEDPYSRVSQIQTGCPMKFTKAGMVKCPTRDRAKAIEKAIHADLEPYRSMGEWFRFDWADADCRNFLHTMLEGNFSAIREWKFEPMDLPRLWSWKRLMDKHKKEPLEPREKRRRAA